MMKYSVSALEKMAVQGFSYAVVVTDPSVTFAHKVDPGLQDLQK